MITNFLRALLTEPLLLEPRFGALLTNVLARKVAGAQFSGAELHAALGIAAPGGRQAARDARIAVIPVVGLIAQRAQSMGASTDQIAAQLQAALASKSVDAILFDVDSPGGTVTGVPELAAQIRDARGMKPMAAVSNGLMASAAYWIGAAAGKVFITPSGEAGSIGVYTAHEDWSKALEEEGIKITEIKAGKYKTEGAPWLPASEEFVATVQARVDEVYGWFVKAVAEARHDTQTNVRAGYGEGRVLGAQQSVKANLADAVGTFEDAIAWLAQRVDASRAPKADALRRELEVARLR